jgi:signal transduction histidine kinase
MSAAMRNIDTGRVDGFVGLLLGAAIGAQVWSSYSGNTRLLGLLAGIIFGGGVAVRRRLPLAGLSVITIVLVVKAVMGIGQGALHNATGAMPALLLMLYGLGAFAPPRRSLPMAVVLNVMASIDVLVTKGQPVSALVPALMVGVVPYVLGRRVRARAERSRVERERAEQIDASADSAARAATLAERASIARDLHDVIAHSVSVMVIQCGAARTVLDAEPDRADAALRTVEQAGRDALAEMRRLVGVLDDDLASRRHAPLPGLGDLDDLVARARDAGLDVTVRVDGHPSPLPPALELCAYRVLQEALTNAIKHAAPARVDVRAAWTPRSLELEVIDDGHGARRARAVAGGNGIIGMRERVAAHHGTFEAGPRPRGGFGVHAVLPLALERAR